MTLAPDMILAGRFRLRARIGAGAQGEVWAAAHLPIRRWVALTLLHADLGRDPALHAQLRASLVVPAELNDPGLRAVFDVEHDPVRGLFLVMELLEGASLDRLLEDRGILAPGHAAWCAAEAAAVLARLHARDCAHGNLGVTQIFVERSDPASAGPVPANAGPVEARPRIRLLSPGLSRFAAQTSARTTVDTDWGPPLSMAPEQLDHGEITPAADLWALGAALFQSLVGRPPFARDTPLATLRAIAAEAPPPLPPGIPPALVEAIEGCLRRDPDLRPTAAGLRDQLTPLASPLPAAWLDAYRLDLGPAPGPEPAAARPPAPAEGETSSEGFAVDMHAERDEDLGTAATLLADGPPATPRRRR